MNIIKPHVEWWPQKTIAQQIARVGRICYKSAGRQPPEKLGAAERETFIQKRDERRCMEFWDSGHKSMLRHGSVYFFIPSDEGLPKNLWTFFEASPYISYVTQKGKMWLSTNVQFLLDHPYSQYILDPHQVTEQEFIDEALKYKCEEALYLLRMTMVITTQISISRELNRASPNAISEQSTRYCNLEKKGGVQIAEPQWYQDGTWWQRFLYRTGCKVGEWVYGLLLKSGLKAQNARGVLPLDTYTVVAYTYSIQEWAHILYLRYHEKTGKAHPDAKAVASDIRSIIMNRMAQYISKFDI